MAIKFLLVALTTVRVVEGEKRRVRFAAKSTPDLTDDEIKTLDDLTKSTGKLHYRDPINEGGNVTASAPEVVVGPKFAGEDVSIDNKTVDQLKAYLSFYKVEIPSGATKAKLQDLANDKKAELDADDSGDDESGADDQDGGL